MKRALVISGSGGQGVMSAGVMTAQTAVEAGKYATYLPEYGPQQRGGSAKCTVVINESEIVSPLIKRCDYLIAMNEQAYKKFIMQLKEGGILVVNTNRLVSELSRNDIRVVPVPCDDIATEIGNVRGANIIMLGALIGASDSFITEDAMLESMKKKFAKLKPEIQQLNFDALHKGIAIGREAKKSF